MKQTYLFDISEIKSKVLIKGLAHLRQFSAKLREEIAEDRLAYRQRLARLIIKKRE